MDSLHLWATYGLIAATVVGYALERWPIEMVAAGSLSAFLLLFALVPYTDPSGATLAATELLSGFANPALITVLALLMVGQGLFQTDAMAEATGAMTRLFGARGKILVVAMLVSAGLLSAFLNNTPVVVIFIPILAVLSAQRGVPPGHVFMALSFVSILGGMTTLIGSSTNLLAAGTAARSGIEIGFFDFTVPGLAIAAVGTLYVLFVMPRLLTPRAGAGAGMADAPGKQFLGEIVIKPGHTFEGTASVAGLFRGLGDLTPRMILRGDETILPPFEDVVLASGDRVIVTATRKTFSRALSRGEFDVRTIDTSGAGSRRASGTNLVMAEAVVAPGSRYAGRTMEFSGLRTQFGISLFGLQRKSRMARSRPADIRLEPGDTLLLCAPPERIDRLKGNHDLLLLEHSAASVPRGAKATTARAIFLAIVAFSASGLMPIEVLAVAGAFAMVATGCLTAGEAARAFDRAIYLLVGASIAAAIALERTGGAALLADATVDLLGDLPPAAILSGFFLPVALSTNFVSNNAAAVLFTPIAIDIAHRIGAPPEAFVACVIFGANACFATPIGYQTNLLVMGPGHYRFMDYVKAGLPLVVIVWFTFSLVGPWYFGL